MQTANAFLRLSECLKGFFTVYRVERRGRPPSGGYGDHHGMAREIEDVRAILEGTGARYVFGLSVGALITLCAAREIPSIAKIALYEPPLEIAGLANSPLACIPAFRKALAADDKASALVIQLKAIDDPSLMTRTPDFILKTFFRCAMGMKPPGSHLPMRDLIPTALNDNLLALEVAGTIMDYRSLQTPTLLMGGDGSRPFLAKILDGLEATLPHTKRVTISGTGHLGPSDEGHPEQVAGEIGKFLLASAPMPEFRL